ncbi:hypothetical protein PP2015_1960 [Pseudoalteromonas phenolica]|uniref:Uncharacterized protein n=1 Tax=Pseudoalteromonas phenolica TaxID=161398 RepID=A0A0S2K2B1_9GAMM|nr:hypothetical protein PP2015_1960 [Pseudoalteromonas phenolica]MBE0356444.1 hypothetical protein [Pseudoalteromonas phenolica O-BC30]
MIVKVRTLGQNRLFESGYFKRSEDILKKNLKKQNFLFNSVSQLL